MKNPMTIFHAVLFACAFQFAVSSKQPFGYSTEDLPPELMTNITAILGKTVDLPCLVESITKDHMVAWFRLEPQTLLTLQSTVVSANERISTIRESDFSWTLRINDLTKFDRGQYMCQVNAEPMINYIVNLNVVGEGHGFQRGACSPKTVFADWNSIKNQVQQLKPFRDGDEGNLLSYTELNVGVIPMTWCPTVTTTCRKPGTICTPRAFEEKTKEVRVTVHGESWLLSLSYLEAKACNCRSKHHTLVDFPAIVSASLKKPGVIPTIEPDVTESPDESRPLDISHQPTIIYVGWDTLRNKLNTLKSRLPDAISDDILSQAKQGSRAIPIKWCSSEFMLCPEPGTKSAPRTMDRKSTAMSIIYRGRTILVTIDYMEARECHCRETHLPHNIFPVIVQAEIMEPCTYQKGHDEPDIISIAYIGWKGSIQFQTFSTAVINSATIFRAEKPTQPLNIESNVSRKIKTTSLYVDLDDWRSKAKANVGTNDVRLELRNITYLDEDVYYCSVRFVDFSECFARVDLRVFEKPLEKIPFDNCEPRMTYYDWPNFRVNLRINATVESLLSGVNISKTFGLMKCRSELTPCDGFQRSCQPAMTKTKKETFCIEDHDGNEVKLELDYLEDATCFCGMEMTSLAGGSSPTHEREIDVVRVDRVGMCPKKCHPETTRIPWTDLKEHLNKWTYLQLALSVSGQDIWVKRCSHEPDLCGGHPSSYCQAAQEIPSQKIVKLKYVNLELVFDVLEATACECKEDKDDDLLYDLGSKIQDPPFIRTHDKKFK